MTDTPTTPPVPATEDAAVGDAAKALWARGIDPSVRECRRIARIALDAAGVPARTEDYGTRTIREWWLRAEAERDEARTALADLRGRMEALPRYDYGDGTLYVAGDTTEAGAVNADALAAARSEPGQVSAEQAFDQGWDQCRQNPYYSGPRNPYRVVTDTTDGGA